ncbi:hypothetical protein M9H77_08860 [Catharanthus roseus]|uniref:Uncharacterized protein n=1 Tax=Catharanthus roseus TaxID=4058 RepID=A0ACC0BZ53_CATRO|nr:hypothetical protein M9H77_08860 [Catharanthus roseus]
MDTRENWQLSVRSGRHNHKIVVYNHGHAQAARLTKEQLQQTEQFRKTHEPPRNILRFFCEQNISCTVRVWTSEVLHFGVETTNRAESEHSVLKLSLSTCHGDLDTVFLNIDSLIKGQIAEIKTSLEISKLKEKYGVKSNLILKNISNNISYLALKKIWLEIKRAGEISDDPQSKCGYYLRKSHSLTCACELVGKSSGSGSGSGSNSGSRSGPSPRGRGRPSRSGRDRAEDYCSNTSYRIHIEPTAFHAVTYADGCPLPPMHVQWQYHRDVGVSGWADHY